LFPEDFNDVAFQSSDEVSIPAHENVVASFSGYFRKAFLQKEDKGDYCDWFSKRMYGALRTLPRVSNLGWLSEKNVRSTLHSSRDYQVYDDTHLHGIHLRHYFLLAQQDKHSYFR